MTKYLLLPLLLCFISCTIPQKKLASYPIIQKSFEAKEIDDFQKILDFFDDFICQSLEQETNSIPHCYPLYFDRLNQVADLSVLFPTTQQIEGLLQQLQPRTIHQIWSVETVIRDAEEEEEEVLTLPDIDMESPFANEDQEETEPDTIQILQFNSTGNYQQFLHQYQQENSFIDNYFQTLEAVGALSPFITLGAFTHDEVDALFDDDRMRLVIAIELLKESYYSELIKNLSQMERQVFSK